MFTFSVMSMLNKCQHLFLRILELAFQQIGLLHNKKVILKQKGFIAKMVNCKISVLISFVVLHLSPVPFANAQEFSLGRCPRFPTVTNFDAQRVH